MIDPTRELLGGGVNEYGVEGSPRPRVTFVEGIANVDFPRCFIVEVAEPDLGDCGNIAVEFEAAELEVG